MTNKQYLSMLLAASAMISIPAFADDWDDDYSENREFRQRNSRRSSDDWEDREDDKPRRSVRKQKRSSDDWEDDFTESRRDDANDSRRNVDYDEEDNGGWNFSLEAAYFMASDSPAPDFDHKTNLAGVNMTFMKTAGSTLGQNVGFEYGAMLAVAGGTGKETANYYYHYDDVKWTQIDVMAGAKAGLRISGGNANSPSLSLGVMGGAGLSLFQI